jgi:hypothetical protein
MTSRLEGVNTSPFSAMLALSLLLIGAVLCLYAVSALPQWYAGISHMGLREQWVASIHSGFLMMAVVTLMWLERMLVIGFRYIRQDGLSRYRGLSRSRKLMACVFSGIVAASATAMAMLVGFDASPPAAVTTGVFLFGAAMFWLEWRLVFAAGLEAGDCQRYQHSDT